MEKRKLEIDFETAKSYYESGNEALKSIALQVFPELEKKELPKTWDELDKIKGYYVDAYSLIVDYSNNPYSSNKNTFATKEQAEASIALAQLSQLREVYRNGWVPDWENQTNKHVINLYNGKLSRSTYGITSFFLSFQDEETRNLFFENFRDLIEKARPLMS